MASLLLDTCALLWLGAAPERLSLATRMRIEQTPFIHVSPVSLWEIALSTDSANLNFRYHLGNGLER